MTKYIGGTAMYIKFEPVGGGTAVLQAQYTKFEEAQTGEVTEVSSGSASDKEYLPTLKDKTFSYEGYDNGTASPLGTADLYLMQPDTVGTLSYGVHGTAAGQPKGAVLAIVKTLSRSFPYADKVSLKIDWQGSGTWLSNPAKGTWG